MAECCFQILLFGDILHCCSNSNEFNERLIPLQQRAAITLISFHNVRTQAAVRP